MKTIYLGALAVLTVTLVSPVYVRAAEVSEVVANHQAASASYEQKAAGQDTLIAEHEQMKKDYERKYYLNEKVTPKSGLHGKMEKHCNAIIKAAQQEKEALLEFAKWHEMRAAELQGQ